MGSKCNTEANYANNMKSNGRKTVSAMFKFPFSPYTYTNDQGMNELAKVWEKVVVEVWDTVPDLSNKCLFVSVAVVLLS